MTTAHLRSCCQPDIDLVVCSANVKRHYDLIQQSLLAGKGAIAEWPLGASLKAGRRVGYYYEREDMQVCDGGAAGEICASCDQGKGRVLLKR